MVDRLLIKNAAQIVTPEGNTARHGREMKQLKIYENQSILIENGMIRSIGNQPDWEKLVPADKQIDATGKAVLPGFVDSHTHLVFGGYRPDEFLWRMGGMSYMEIMERGVDFLKKMLAMGVTTVEAKSGYGQDHDTEIKQMEVVQDLNEKQPIELVSTFLGAHAVPPEFKGRGDDFIEFLLKDVMPEVAEKHLAEFCDVFCEKGVFSIEQSRHLLTEARKMGFKLKIHADEIVSLGGAELAGELHATSADHLLHASDAGIRAMADNGVVSTLLPTTAFCLKEPFARAREMIDSGCAVALATDFNPGSGFTFSVPLMIGLAVIYMKMTAEEAITALTLNGAAAVDRADRIGSLEPGKQADLVILQYPSYKFLPYHTGINIVETVVKKGKVVFR